MTRTPTNLWWQYGQVSTGTVAMAVPFVSRRRRHRSRPLLGRQREANRHHRHCCRCQRRAPNLECEPRSSRKPVLAATPRRRLGRGDRHGALTEPHPLTAKATGAVLRRRAPLLGIPGRNGGGKLRGTTRGALVYGSGPPIDDDGGCSTLPSTHHGSERTGDGHVQPRRGLMPGRCPMLTRMTASGSPASRRA